MRLYNHEFNGTKRKASREQGISTRKRLYKEEREKKESPAWRVFVRHFYASERKGKDTYIHSCWTYRNYTVLSRYMQVYKFDMKLSEHAWDGLRRGCSRYKALHILIYKSTNMKASCKSYEKAIELETTFAMARQGKGAALGTLRKYEEALSAYSEAVELDNTWEGTRRPNRRRKEHLNLAMIYKHYQKLINPYSYGMFLSTKSYQAVACQRVAPV
jgi:tetratricopeptide (TPR) repeat protein